jgi:lipopolysaccharide biosynthesis glycosyltransferase
MTQIDRIFVACGADERYALPMTVTLFSMLTHLCAGVVPEVVILDGGIEPGTRERVTGVLQKVRPDARLRWLTVDMERFRGTFSNRVFSKAAYLWLMLPDLLADQDRALYLDSDMLVLRDVLPLYRQTLGPGDFLAAVPDYDIGPEPDGWTFFNSGVALMNLAAWRASDLGGQVIANLHEHNLLGDQATLNRLLRGRWVEMNYWWNVQNPFLHAKTLANRSVSEALVRDGRAAVRSKAAIVHFTGHKPWNSCLRHPFRPMYHQYVRDTGWFSAPEFAAWTARYYVDATVRRRPMPARRDWCRPELSLKLQNGSDAGAPRADAEPDRSVPTA